MIFIPLPSRRSLGGLAKPPTPGSADPREPRDEFPNRPIRRNVCRDKTGSQPLRRSPDVRTAGGKVKAWHREWRVGLALASRPRRPRNNRPLAVERQDGGYGRKGNHGRP